MKGKTFPLVSALLLMGGCVSSQQNGSPSNSKQLTPSSEESIVFGAIDTGLLTIPALWGGILFGVAGAIAGGVIGDAVTDAIAGFFEGSIAEWLRERGIVESREAITSALGKMAGCLIGSGVILTIAILLGIKLEFG